jgi:hypothetical protein
MVLTNGLGNRVKSNLGRLRQRIRLSQEQAASQFKPNEDGFKVVRRIRHYEAGKGTVGLSRQERVEYVAWLIRRAEEMKLPDIPPLAELVPDETLQADIKKGWGGNPSHTHGKVKGANQ